MPKPLSTADPKERPFRGQKCKSTFVRRDLLLRHDRTVHAKDGGVPLVSEVKRKTTTKPSSSGTNNDTKPAIALDTATLEQIEVSSDGRVDLEAAAMLITDLKHKANAIMANHDVEAEHSSSTYSPDRNMFDTGVPYLSNGVAMSSWDPFVLHPVNEPKASSISSSFSGSQDSQLSQLSFTSTGTVLPQDQHLPELVERYPSHGDSLAPTLHMSNSLPVSGSATPNGLSPYPYLMGPVSPVDYRRSPGPTQPLSTPKAPQIHSDLDYRKIQDNFTECDMPLDAPPLSKQTREDMNTYLAAYFKLFHHHLPFLHPETFDPVTAPIPLLLATVSIGALYTLHSEQAVTLHVGSKVLVSAFLQKKDFDSRKVPLWAMQSTLLNMIFASWSGDAKGLEWACSIKSLLANVRTPLDIRAPHQPHLASHGLD